MKEIIGTWQGKSDNKDIAYMWSSPLSAFISLYESDPNSKNYSLKLLYTKEDIDKSLGSFKIEELERYRVEFDSGLIIEIEAFSIQDAIKEASKLHSCEIINVKSLRTEVEK